MSAFIARRAVRIAVYVYGGTSNMKAEEFIKDYTRNCSNELDYVGTTCKVYQPWLTPEQALRAVEIEREELIEKACEWIKEKWDDNYTMPIIIDSVIDDFKNYIK